MKKRFAVRRARPRDLERILEIEVASFGADAYNRNLFAEYTRKCGDLFLVAVGGALAGGGAIAAGAAVAKRATNVYGYAITCLCAGGTEDRAELVSLAVDPAARGNGAASALMDSTLRRLKLRGVGRLGLTVKLTNQPARAFYEKYGFRKLRRVPRYYEDGADGLLLVKDLAGPRK